MGAEGDTIKTGVDKLVDLIREKKRISIEEAAKALSIPKVLVEEWADFLEEKEVIGIEYKFAIPYLVYKELTQEEVQGRAKEFAGRREGFVRKVDSMIQSIDQQTEGFANVKAEFRNLAKELDSDVTKIKDELKTLSEYEQMKDGINSQITQQQQEFDKQSSSIENQMMIKKRAVHSLMEQLDAQESRLSRDEKIAMLIRKKEDALQKNVEAMFKKAQVLEQRRQQNDSAIKDTVRKITEIRQLSGNIKSDLGRHEAGLAPLLEESRKHEQKIAELKKSFLQKVASMSQAKNGIKASAAKEATQKFKNLFARKEEAEQMVGKLDADLVDLKSQLKALADEAMVVRLTSKSKNVADYVKDFEERFVVLDKKKEKFRGEVAKLAAILKKL